MDLPQNTLACSATILTILRSFFQHSVGRSLPQWAWDPDPLVSRLSIDLGFNPRVEEKQKYPKITVQRGPFTTRRSAFGDVLQHEWPGVSTKALYNKEVYGTININVFSLEGGEAEAIANMVFELFVTQEQLLEKEFKFKWLGETTLGALGVLEEDRAVFVVPINLSPVVYDFAWSNQEKGPLLKALHLEADDATGQIRRTVYKEFFPTRNPQ